MRPPKAPPRKTKTTVTPKTPKSTTPPIPNPAKLHRAMAIAFLLLIPSVSDAAGFSFGFSAFRGNNFSNRSFNVGFNRGFNNFSYNRGFNNFGYNNFAFRNNNFGYNNFGYNNFAFRNNFAYIPPVQLNYAPTFALAPVQYSAPAIATYTAPVYAPVYTIQTYAAPVCNNFGYAFSGCQY